MTKPRKSQLATPAARPESLSRDIVAERATLMKALSPVVKMLGTIVGPNIEVVLHDLMQPEHSIISIANGHISNRSVGSSIISGPKGDLAFVETKKQLSKRGDAEHAIIDNYATETASGLRLRSSTVVFRDKNGDPFAALCLNADMTMLQAAHHFLGQFVAPLAQPADAQAQPKPAMDTLISEIIDEAVQRLGKPVSLMNKAEKTQAVQVMLKRGLFIVKGGVERAAASLGVSRFTIYNYLDAIRQREGGDEGASEKPEPSVGKAAKPASHAAAPAKTAAKRRRG